MIALLIAACTGEDPSESSCEDTGGSCACDAASVQVGGGADRFDEVADGTGVTMIHGPQGGWHVLGSARVDHTSDLVTLHYTIEVPSRSAVVSDNTYRVVLVSDGECSGYYPGMYGFLNVSALAEGEANTPPEILTGEELVLRMSVVDADGRTAEDELHAIAEPDPADVEDTEE